MFSVASVSHSVHGGGVYLSSHVLSGGISGTRSLLGDTQEVSTRGVSTQVSEYPWGEYSPLDMGTQGTSS